MKGPLTPKEKIYTLQRRAKHLEERLKQPGASRWDVSELDALRLAISLMEREYPEIAQELQESHEPMRPLRY